MTDLRDTDPMLHMREEEVTALRAHVRKLEEYIQILESPEVYGQNWREKHEAALEKER